MAMRVVEYVVVVGLASRKQQTRGRSSSPAIKEDETKVRPEHQVGSVLQRFPAEDRRKTPLPRGIEIFCQPLGWKLVSAPSPPTNTTFILTAEDGRRLYCSSLTFYQLQAQANRSSRRLMTVPVALDICGVPSRRNAMPRMKSSPSFDFLDEANEARWSPESILNQPAEVFEPVCLCLVSRFPFFETLQSCLKSLYITWVAGHSNLEPLISELLTKVTLPPINCLPVKRPFGALKELALHPIHEEASLPYTSTAAFKLLQSIGVHSTIYLVSAVLSDTSVLFISSSFTALTGAVQSVCALIHPLKLSHALVPLVPESLLDYVQLPSIYIMGIHSSLRKRVEGLGDVVEVYLDDGRVCTPPTLAIPTLPQGTMEPVHRALARVLNPRIEFRDHLFGMETAPVTRNPELQDKEVRAIFLCLLLSLLGDCQQFVTVLRFHPVPSFSFNKEEYLQSHCGDETHSLLHKMVEGIALMDFVHSRSIPHRSCDFFDELVARHIEHPENYTTEKLYSKEHIDSLAEELLHMLPPTAAGDKLFETRDLTQQDLCYPFKAFPQLKERRIEEAMKQYQTKEETEEDEEAKDLRKIPLLDSVSSRLEKSNSPSFQRDLDSLRNCLDALFQGKILEARKYIPIVTQALKNRSLAHSLVPEMVRWLLKIGGVLLSSDQFDVVVKIVNSALIDSTTALALLPVSTIMYREINPGVQQYICTCVQHHSIWSKLDFWKNALYSAVQAELVRIYTEFEFSQRPRMLSEEKEEEIHVEEPPDAEFGEVTLRSRQRLRTSDPSHLRALRHTVLSKTMRVRMRASMVVPGVSEGVLPPNAEPVTSGEALHHLAKQLQRWPSLSEEEQVQLSKQEENAVQNQLILFVQRIIQLRIPVEYSGDGEREGRHTELIDFISRFLRLVELELNFDFAKHGKIREQIQDMIDIHIGSLEGLRKELKRLPLSKIKAAITKPPLLDGETMVGEGVHCYLLPDGRENGLLVPADGHIFITSYRVIFLGTPCNPEAPNVIVTRSLPIASIFRVKRLQPHALPQLAIQNTAGLQMRSVTAELLRVGFDEDVGQHDVKNVIQKIVDLRNPTKITRGLKAMPPKSPTPTDVSSSLTASQFFSAASKSRSDKSRGLERSNILGSSDTLTRVKQISDLSRSPCCQEYERMSLGSLNFSAQYKGPWRVTALNMTYAVCNSYPAVLVVPDKATDDTLISVAAQFQHGRFPVVTWKHSRKHAVLLRSSCFVPSNIPQRVITGGALGYVQNTVLQQGAKLMGAGGKFVQQGAHKEKGAISNLGGTGVFNVDVENYLLSVLLVSQHVRSEGSRNDLFVELSMPPTAVQFDPEQQRNPPTTPPSRKTKLVEGSRAKSWGSTTEDIDFTPELRRRGIGDDKERSLTPEPELHRLYASPKPIRKGRRHFSMTQLFKMATSPSMGRKKRYQVDGSEGNSSPELGRKHASKLDRVASSQETGATKTNAEGEGGKEGEDNTAASPTETEGKKGKVGKGDEGKKEEGEMVNGGEEEKDIRDAPKKESEGREGEGVQEEMEEDGQGLVVNKSLLLDTLNAQSPTQGLPKFYKHRSTKSASFIDTSDYSPEQDIDLGDITMIEDSPISTEQYRKRDSTIDWEAVGNIQTETPPVDSRPSTTTPEPLSPDVRGEGEGGGGKEGRGQEEAGVKWEQPEDEEQGEDGEAESSPAMFSSLPTNPRDWITVDALPSQLSHWQASALYIIGDKSVLREVPEDLYPNCTFVPVEVPTPADVSHSFKKLMRACIPSGPNTSTYLAAVEESGWITQLSTIMEVAGAVADLMDIQGSSVLVCLENGWDATAQVVSLAQVLLDPFYRTIDGFKALIEKDWLSFGHRFSQNGNHTTSSNISGFTPMFLQFLDLVHQVMIQFPLSFEFTDFYLRLMAYHHSSMRFHTFAMNTEKERYFSNWLPYRPRIANFHGSTGQAEPHVSYWDYVDTLHAESTLLYNFKYKHGEEVGSLHPHSYQANLCIWSFYLDNLISKFPPYDTELMSGNDLTPLDLHHNFFEKEKSVGQSGLTFVSDVVAGMSGVGTLLLEYTALMNRHAQKSSLPFASWKELWEELQDSVDNSSPLFPVLPSDQLLKSHGLTLHKRTTVAVLIKGKLAVELEKHFTYPHQFEAASLTTQHECGFCKHQIMSRDAHKCKNCGCVCHSHCTSLMPYNCGHKNAIYHRRTKRNQEYPERTYRSRLSTSTFYSTKNQNEPPHTEGYLYKRGKIVKNWKLRWFILDTDKNELSYYDSKQLDKCYGTISLLDVVSVTEADPQVVPSLKPGEAGFFFNLNTHKRVYNLMARRNVERAEWMVRLNNALSMPPS